jgi:hypothetical protein
LRRATRSLDERVRRRTGSSACFCTPVDKAIHVVVAWRGSGTSHVDVSIFTMVAASRHLRPAPRGRSWRYGYGRPQDDRSSSGSSRRGRPRSVLPAHPQAVVTLAGDPLIDGLNLANRVGRRAVKRISLPMRTRRDPLLALSSVTPL